MANAEQLERLKRDVRVWNNWRTKHPKVPIDLSGADLRGADLSGANLSKADLSGANLSEADLREALLSKARLTGADLTKADLRKAILEKADLTGANLTGANLAMADLTGAKLAKADLTGADLQDTRLGEELEAARREARRLEESRIEAVREAMRFEERRMEAEREARRLEERRMEAEREAAPPPLTRGEPPPSQTGSEPAPPTLEEVGFTAIYPREGQVETWHTLLVYVHLLSAMEALRRDAQRFADQIPSPKEISVPASTRLRRGTELTIVPSCEKVTFNPERLVVKWMEDFHRADFRFRGDKSLADDAARGQINIYAGPVIVGTLTFAMLFNKTAPSLAPQQEEHGKMYRQEEIFISYSHKDTAVVLSLKKAYEVLGFNVLIDVDDLRAGQVWNDELMHMIDRASIFQLFWSQNSSQSKYCRQEWEHALKHKKEGFIRPVYWEKPIPDPPDELSKYHFEYMEVEAPPATRG